MMHQSSRGWHASVSGGERRKKREWVTHLYYHMLVVVGSRLGLEAQQWFCLPFCYHLCVEYCILDEICY